MRITFFSMILLALCSCKKLESRNELKVHFYDCKHAGSTDLQICFASLREYRCPCNLNCIWPGAVDVRLAITNSSGLDTMVWLTHQGNQGSINSAVIGGHDITLQDVYVPDFCKDYGDSTKYAINLKID